MMGELSKKAIGSRSVLLACGCIALARLVQFASLWLKAGGMPTWDKVFVEFSNVYAGIFLAAPCLILALHPLNELIAWDAFVIRCASRKAALAQYVRLVVATAFVCALWMAAITVVAVLVTYPSADALGYVVLIVLESAVMQILFCVASACLYLMGCVASGSGAIASIGVVLYAGIDMIVAGIPVVSQWFPATGWAIVQISQPLEVLPFLMRGVLPALVIVLAVSGAQIAYQGRDFLGKADARHGS